MEDYVGKISVLGHSCSFGARSIDMSAKIAGKWRMMVHICRATLRFAHEEAHEEHSLSLSTCSHQGCLAACRRPPEATLLLGLLLAITTTATTTTVTVSYTHLTLPTILLV
eukprot:3418416-Pyramimonas_sp.AAC.1